MDEDGVVHEEEEGDLLTGTYRVGEVLPDQGQKGYPVTLQQTFGPLSEGVFELAGSQPVDGVIDRE